MSSAPKSLDSMLAKIKERAANAPAAPAIPPERRQLPLWPDLERAIPNHLAATPRQTGATGDQDEERPALWRALV